MSRSHRDAVSGAYDFVRSYTDERGGVPPHRVDEMAHMLAHCWMSVVVAFLKPYGFADIGEFKQFLRAHGRNIGKYALCIDNESCEVEADRAASHGEVRHG